MKDSTETLRLPAVEEFIAPVTIFDAQGQVVQVVAAADFRRSHPRVTASRYPMAAVRRRSRDGDPS